MSMEVEISVKDLEQELAEYFTKNNTFP